jgi:hypothetical protein
LLIDQIADNIAAILECKQLVTGEQFSETSKNRIGPENGWDQTNISTPFYFDANRPV